ncbi:hypothetical protein DERP_014614 [Dermatophagoides pteronyssinus]|uniref:Uncharacterized protein n=1 Tax=Dermatophagoides pteronyssinus TaxID=6956 RepID=A0ABQ8IVZ9_DERPT|nr:hypothetical protein DERP_014614 [Dermatophagoides pteronyssinus]
MILAQSFQQQVKSIILVSSLKHNIFHVPGTNNKRKTKLFAKNVDDVRRSLYGSGDCDCDE